MVLYATLSLQDDYDNRQRDLILKDAELAVSRATPLLEGIPGRPITKTTETTKQHLANFLTLFEKD